MFQESSGGFPSIDEVIAFEISILLNLEALQQALSRNPKLPIGIQLERVDITTLKLNLLPILSSSLSPTMVLPTTVPMLLPATIVPSTIPTLSPSFVPTTVTIQNFALNDFSITVMSLTNPDKKSHVTNIVSIYGSKL